MSPTFLNAAASYFGINPEQIAGSDWHNADGQLVVSFEFNVSEDDLLGIADRMKVLRLAQPEPDLSSVPYPIPDSDELRKAYNALSKEGRGRFGSFARFVAVGGAQPAEVPPYVLLNRNEVTDLQKATSSLDPASGKYMVQVDDLEPHQRPHLQIPGIA